VRARVFPLAPTHERRYEANEKIENEDAEAVRDDEPTLERVHAHRKERQQRGERDPPVEQKRHRLV